MLKVQGLKKAFGIDELFSDVNFEISRGDKVGFVGPNGAGKTTLMRCLMGLEESDGGTVAFDTNATIGYVEQQADFGDGTLFEEFKRAFEDIIELGERKKALEKAIAEKHDEETLAAYGRVVERFELLGGYDSQRMSSRKMSSTSPGDRRPASAWPRPCCGSRISSFWTSPPIIWT